MLFEKPNFKIIGNACTWVEYYTRIRTQIGGGRKVKYFHKFHK